MHSFADCICTILLKYPDMAFKLAFTSIVLILMFLILNSCMAHNFSLISLSFKGAHSFKTFENSKYLAQYYSLKKLQTWSGAGSLKHLDQIPLYFYKWLYVETQYSTASSWRPCSLFVIIHLLLLWLWEFVLAKILQQAAQRPQKFFYHINK